jgi:DNA gyrase/topoisomerase IV subunit A
MLTQDWMSAMKLKAETKVEIDKLKKRYRDLDGSIDDLLEALSRGSTTSDEVLSRELTKARMELASIARRLQGLQNDDD